MAVLWTYYVLHRIQVILCRKYIIVTVRVSMIRVRISVSVRITAEVGMPVPEDEHG